MSGLCFASGGVAASASPREPTSASAARAPQAAAPTAASDTALPRSTLRRESPRAAGASRRGWSERVSSCRRFAILDLLLGSILLFGGPLSTEEACARHLARLDPTEPIFTERAFVEGDLEIDAGWEHQGDADSVELAPGFSWIALPGFELDLEIPVGISIPDQEATVADLGDVGVAAQWQPCCAPDQLLDYLSLRAEIDAPTGSRSKDIDGRIRPVVELLGTTVVDATIDEDEGTAVRLAGGVWVAPFRDEHWLCSVSIGLGWSFPVTRRRDSDVEGRLALQWSFGS